MKKQLILFLTCFFIGINFFQVNSVAAKNNQSDNLTVHMLAVEYKGKLASGEEIEVYRWEPGTIFLPKGKEVTLNILGVNGKEHPFYIEGTDITGVVKKGKETQVKVLFEKEGIYRIVCTAHPTREQNGPMIGYIVVK